MCLVDDQLETAASYLIILQNLERLFTFVIKLQVCLVDDQLETAASYLIILQNLERPIISKQVSYLTIVKQKHEMSL